MSSYVNYTYTEDSVWKSLEMDEIMATLNRLFPSAQLNGKHLFHELIHGNLLNAMLTMGEQLWYAILGQVDGLKGIIGELILLGLIAAFFQILTEIFHASMAGELGFYFSYFLLLILLTKNYEKMVLVAEQFLENLTHFLELFLPCFIGTVGLATGPASASGYYQLFMLLLFIFEKLFLYVCMPAVYLYEMFGIMNGLWLEDKLNGLSDICKQALNFILKALIGITTGISLFQSLIAPTMDGLTSTALQKVVSGIPLFGNMSEGVLQMVIGSSVLIKNVLGVFICLLLVCICAIPMFVILIRAVLLKVTAGLMGIVCDKRFTKIVAHTGEAGIILFKIMLTAASMLLLIISIAAYTTGRRW